MKSIEGLHVILGCNEVARTCELARMAEAEGASVIQLREKSRSTSEVLEIADALRNLIRRCVFIVNDRADIAYATGADGVHLGQDDLPIEAARTLLGPNAIIGVSTGTVEEAVQAERSGSQYIGFGHMFPTRSKEKTSLPRTTEELRAVIAAVSIPVIAIGGITSVNMGGIINNGLGGIAVISAIRQAENPAEVIRRFVRRLEERRAVIA